MTATTRSRRSASASNTQALARIASEAGVATVHRVEHAHELPALTGTVAVTAGASAPEYLVEDVVRHLAPAAGVEVVTLTTESEYFRLPRAVRSAVEHAIADDRLPADLVDAYTNDRTTPATKMLALVERHLESLAS